MGGHLVRKSASSIEAAKACQEGHRRPCLISQGHIISTTPELGDLVAQGAHVVAVLAAVALRLGVLQLLPQRRLRARSARQRVSFTACPTALPWVPATPEASRRQSSMSQIVPQCPSHHCLGSLPEPRLPRRQCHDMHNVAALAAHAFQSGCLHPTELSTSPDRRRQSAMQMQGSHQPVTSQGLMSACRIPIAREPFIGQASAELARTAEDSQCRQQCPMHDCRVGQAHVMPPPAPP